MFKEVLNSFHIKKHFNSKEDYHKLLLYITGETIPGSIIAVKSIILLEIMMIFMAITLHKENPDKVNPYYLVFYFILLVASIIGVLIATYIRKDMEHRYLIFIYGSKIYSMGIMLWSILITYLDMKTTHNYSLVVYMTIMMIIPVATYLDPAFLVLQNIVGSAIIEILIYRYDTSEIMKASFINFFVYAFVAILVGYAYTTMRLKNYYKHIQLLAMNQKLKDSAEVDFLSGLYNRTKLNEVSQQLWLKGLETQTALACILCDIDNFKQINDTYGHQEGDRWIQEMAALLQETVTYKNSHCFRYGGEEFLVVIPGINLEEAQEIAERIRMGFEQIRIGNKKHKGTISCGVYCAVPTNLHNIEKFYANADNNLYRAKAKGKNQIY